MQQILIVLAHPDLKNSKANSVLKEAALSMPQVSMKDLYDSYPHSYIHVKNEQACLEGAQIIVLQHPMYWYSVPALLKEWIDATLTSGWAFGKNGRALAGKSWAHAITTGGTQAQYATDADMDIDKLLLPLERTAKLCQTLWHKPFMVNDIDSLSRTELEQHAQRYIAWLKQLSANTLQETRHA